MKRRSTSKKWVVWHPVPSLAVYTGPNSGTGPLDVYQQMADHNTATIVTTSWGGCEPDPTGSPPPNSRLFDMAAQGQSIVAAAGDAGSSDCADDPTVATTGLAVDDPASQPNVTGVGALSVTNSSPLNQSVWNDGIHSGGGAGGGGVSTLWPRPSWQIAPGDNERHHHANGARPFSDGRSRHRLHRILLRLWMDDVGGTSTGAPLVSALAATAAQSCGTAVWALNPLLYAMAGTGFNDVTVGNNDLYGVGRTARASATTWPRASAVPTLRPSSRDSAPRRLTPPTVRSPFRRRDLSWAKRPRP